MYAHGMPFGTAYTTGIVAYSLLVCNFCHILNGILRQKLVTCLAITDWTMYASEVVPCVNRAPYAILPNHMRTSPLSHIDASLVIIPRHHPATRRRVVVSMKEAFGRP